MSIAERYPKLTFRSRHRAEVLRADERARLDEGFHECPESDHLDVLKILEPRVDVLLLLALAALIGVVAVVIVALRIG